MDEKMFTKADFESVAKAPCNCADNKDNSWLPLMTLLTLAFSGKDGVSKTEYVKMKEDIAELKGKMAMIEKMM